MCGISGIVFQDSLIGDMSPITAVNRMNDAMLRRGPDASGVWTDSRVVLGHRRLSIQDLSSNANQPFLSSDGRFAIVFNGEIYNFLDLKTNFLSSDQDFITHSDTEVLIRLYSRYGKEMLHYLRGMFSIAIWDAKEQKLFVARDPYGIKPLYYSFVGGNFVFASQVKALLSSGLIPITPEYAGIAGFYLWGSVPEPWTIYEGVLSLPAGSYLEVSPGDKFCRPINWVDFDIFWERQENLPIPKIKNHIRSAIEDSVDAHLISDVPVGVFLSGGIDSGILAKALSQKNIKTTAITIAFDEFLDKPDDEVPLAKAIANKYNINHHIRRVSKAEFNDDLNLILEGMDQPSIDGINTWYASKAASECGLKVMLSGIGGDELFCGYQSFNQITVLLKIKKFTGLKFGRFAKFFQNIGLWDRLHPKYASCSEYLDTLEDLYFLKRCVFFPHELSGIMGAEQARIGLQKLGGVRKELHPKIDNPIAAISYIETTQYLKNQLLRDSDWASMAHSIELRTPFVDLSLLNRLGPYIGLFAKGRGKRYLADDLYVGIESSLGSKKKTGFGIPVENWMGQQLASENITSGPSCRPDQWSKRWAAYIASKLIPF